MPGPRKILICDNEEKIRKSLGNLLTANGYKVALTENGARCLKILADQVFDLVILDIIMPDMTGIEVLNRIRKKGQNTDVIMITGYADKDMISAAFRLSAYDVIEKPFEPNQILNTISNCLSKKDDFQKNLEKKNGNLKGSEKRYREVSDDSKDMIYMTRNGDLADINKAGVELLGYKSKQEILDMQFLKLMFHNPIDSELFQESMEQNGAIKDYPTKFKTKEGTKISVLITASAIKDQEGNMIGQRGIVRDVTDIEAAMNKTLSLMRKIKEAKEEWETTFDAIEDAIFLIDETFTIQRANKGLAKLVEKDITDIIGQKCYKLLHGINFVPNFCLRSTLIKTCSSQTNELWEPHLNRYLRINCYPITNGNREIREVIHVLRDVTEAQKAHQEIEYLASLVRYSHDAIISTDMKCRITSWNKTAERIFGYSEKEAVGNYVDIIVPKEHRKECHVFVEEIAEGGGFEHYETKRNTKYGNYIDVDLTLSPIKDRKGVIIGISFIARDVTYQKRLEAKLVQAQKMESIGTLAGGIAHDFNNLLMGIQGYASLMLLKIDAMHPHHEMLKRIEEQVQSAADLTKQLLGFARSGRYETRPTNLNELIHKSAEMFGRTKKEIVIHSKLGKDLWTVEVDQGQMEQVLLNLYVNAWHAMPGGGNLYLETSNVTLEKYYVKPYDIKAGNYVKISVTDTGIGMDKKTQKRVFDPFFTTKEMGRGTGLGLASVYGIIINHKGIINVYSEKGHGTTFSIYLPVCNNAIIPVTKLVRNEVMKGTETILLVDDEEQVLDTGRQMLEYLGYRVLAARGGKEAWALYQDNRNRIDLVILDLIMPDTGGGKVYDKMKALNPDVKVILSSGYSLDGEASEVFKRGANAFIQKPFSILTLSYKLREVIGEISPPFNP